MNEHELQSSLIEWARLNIGRYPPLEWLHAIPNGAQYGADRRMAIIQAMKLKAEGLLPGVPDLFLPFAARGYFGFYLELKAPGKLSQVREGQAQFMAYAESAGFLCQVHDSFDGAREALIWYLEDGNK
jgi:hypothetical protein